jgi:hypothetical protein
MRKAVYFVALGSLLLAGLFLARSVAAYDAKSGEVVFYDNYQCTGEPFMVLKKGNYPDLRNYNTGELGSPDWNDRISCLQIGEGTKVTIYEHINYKGKNKTFGRTSSNPNGMWSFAGDLWNDKTSSVKVF